LLAAAPIQVLGLLECPVETYGTEVHARGLIALFARTSGGKRSKPVLGSLREYLGAGRLGPSAYIFVTMGAFTIVLVSLFSAGFGALTALSILQALSGRPILSRGYSWTPGEIKLSGLSWAVFGLAGVGTALVGGLEFGARVIPLYWVGSPWGTVTANPLALILVANLLFQLLIQLHHKRRSRIGA
jgi:hypothetical protein